jgi:cell division protein FtsI (penicillin-binding protein 3)
MNSIKQSIIYRVWVVIFFLIFLALAIIGRIVFIQQAQGDKWLKLMHSSSIMERSIPAIRGNILSDNGSLLATSLPKYRIGFDPNVGADTDRKDKSKANIKLFDDKVDSLCLGLSTIYKDKPASYFRKKIFDARKQWVPRTQEEIAQNKPKRHPFIILDNRYISYEERQKLEKIPMAKEHKLKGGVVIERIDQRAHPFDNMGLRTIGYLLEKEGKGVGLEKSMEPYLQGRPGRGIFEKLKGNNVWKPIEDSPETKPIPGSDVYTTLDVNIQDETESALRKAVEMYQPNYASAIVMEVKTGEIKAIANLSYSKKEKAYTENFNYAVAGGTTPGSTIKLPTMLALLEEGVNPNDSVETGSGTMPYKGKVLSDSKRGGFGKISVQQVFEKSSNIGIVKLTLKTFGQNENKYFDYLKKYKLDQKLGFQINGEPKPTFYMPGHKYYSGFSLPYTSFGGIESAMTPLQMLTFYNAIANDGYWIQPIIVKQIKYGDKVEVDFVESQRRSDEPIASKEAIRKVKKMLEGVVERGTARGQKSDIYRFSGKTGTSKKLKGGTFAAGIYYTAFAGYFPAENPKYSCIVVIDEPKGKNSEQLYAGDVAAPVFRQIADHIYADDLALNKNPKPIKTENTQAPKINYALNDDFKNINEEKFLKNAKIQQSKINVNVNLKSEKNTVPNVIGLSLRDALFVLENKNFKVRYNKIGKVKKQSIPAGTMLSSNNFVFLEM